MTQKQYIPMRWSANSGRSWRSGSALTTSVVGTHLLLQPRWTDFTAGIIYERIERD